MSQMVDGPPEGLHLRAMVKLGDELGSSLWEQANTEKLVASLFPPHAGGENGWGEEIRAGALVIATDAIIERSCPVTARGTDLHRSVDPVPKVWDGWYRLVAGAIQRENERFAKEQTWRAERSRATMLARRGMVDIAGVNLRQEIERLTGLLKAEVPFLPDGMVKGGAAFVASRGVLRFLARDKTSKGRREAALYSLGFELHGHARESFDEALEACLAPHC